MKKDLILPVVIYNSVKKEPIGIFSTKAMLSRYLFLSNKKETVRNTNKLLYSLNNKILIKKDIIFNFPVAVRTANSEQIKLLNNQPYFILNNYPINHKKSIIGFYK